MSKAKFNFGSFAAVKIHFIFIFWRVINLFEKNIRIVYRRKILADEGYSGMTYLPFCKQLHISVYLLEKVHHKQTSHPFAM